MMNRTFFVQLKLAVLWYFLLVLACPLPAFAENEFSIGLGGRSSVTPYKQYDTPWTPFPIISYEGEYAYVRGFTAGVKLVNLEFLEISTFVGYDDTTFSSGNSKDKRLRKLSNRSSSATAGMEAAIDALRHVPCERRRMCWATATASLG